LSGLLGVWQGIGVEALPTFVLVVAVFGTAATPELLISADWC